MKYLGGKTFLVLSVLLCSGFFVGQKCLAAEAGSVVINEIAWMGSAASANAEWLELKNAGSAAVDLSGWTLNAADGQPKINLSGTIPAGGYFLLERTSDDTVPGIAADQIYSGALGNDGEVLELKDGAGNLIDKTDATGAWPAGDNTTKQTMERTASGGWQTSASPGGTPRAANGGQSGVQPPADQNPGSGSSGSGARGAIYGDVIINEFVSDPAAGGNEWVELFNPSGGKLSLSGWSLADGSGAETPLAGGFTEDDYYFYVIEKPKGALNNDGDAIILYSETHNLIDKIIYGKYGNQPENNAPAPGQGQSAALKVDGRKSLTDKDGFALTTALTKGKPNIIAAPEDSGQAATSAPQSAAAGEIAITEIFPNPIGPDREGEFIELYNSSAEEADLAGWRIEVEGNRVFEFGKFFNPSAKLKAGKFYVLYRPASNLVLDNNGGRIRLFAPGKTRAAQLLEYGLAPEGFSFSDTENIDLQNAESATKIYLNNTSGLNRWVWSGTPTPGRFNQIKTPNHPPVASFSAPAKISTGAPIGFDASDSFDEDGNVLSFSWDFGDGVTLDSETPAHVFLRPGSYQVKLTASDGQDISSLERLIKVGGIDLRPPEKAALNQTPIVLPDSAPAQSASAEKKVLGVKTAGKKISSPPVAVAAVLPPVKVKAPAGTTSAAKLGAARKISGTVIVLPGTFGSQYFYIFTATGSPATKIYNYYKRFPALKAGDLISVSGVVGGSEADKYLKTKSAADIKILGQAGMPAPEKITAAGFKEENLGKFVQAEGEVESKSSTEITLNDGAGKINLYLKASAKIDAKRIAAGQKIAATGLLSKAASGLAILPRGDFDLVIATSSATGTGAVLGAATSASDWVLPARENNSRPLVYVLIVVGAVIIVLAGFLIKKRK